MKKLSFLFVTPCLLLLMMAGTAGAYTIPFTVEYNSKSYYVYQEDATGTYFYPNSGTYIGTVINTGNGGANDDVGLVDLILDTYFGLDIQLNDSSKINAPGTSSGDLTITYYAGNQSGTWATYSGDTPPPDVALLDFYIVKAAQSFAIYQVDPPNSEGTWNVEHLFDKQGDGTLPAISHFTGYFESGTPVPEPATMLLFGTGLVGLAGLGRKKLLRK